MTLPDKRLFTIIFDRTSGAAIEAKQVLPLACPEDHDQHFLTLRLLTAYSV